MPVIVRFAPSPTGLLHVGSARTALFNYLFAKKEGGKIFLRIEDTDRERSKPEFEQNIFDSLNWLGLKFDNPEPVRQSERSEIYQKVLTRLIESGAAYVSREENEKGIEENKRSEVIRFKNQNRSITFRDLIRGEITFDTKELGDFVIAKSLTEPLYHFAVIVDDVEMGVTHVIRGEDHISNTPRQILLIEALGAPRPIYVHIPLILASDRSKLSKRHGAVSVTEYRAQGFLSEALVNYLALLGWNPGTDQEIFSLAELVEQFSLAKAQKAGAVFDPVKLNWLNREYLKRLPDETLGQNIPPEIDRDRLAKVLPLMKERMTTLADLTKFVQPGGEFGYFFQSPVYEKALLKNQKHFQKLFELINSLGDSEKEFSAEKIKIAIMPYADEAGRGEVLWPMRVALTGREKSPDPFIVASILGKKETLARLAYAEKLA